MQVIIGDKLIKLSPKLAEASTKIANGYIDSVRAKSAEKHVPELYLGALVLMHMKTGELLSAVTPEGLQVILNAADADSNDDKN